MAVGKNKRLSKGKKGLKKRAQDVWLSSSAYHLLTSSSLSSERIGMSFSEYANELLTDESPRYDIKAPSTFNVRSVGKTLVNRTTGMKNANDALKGWVLVPLPFSFIAFGAYT